jgi:hypothetical protein
MSDNVEFPALSFSCPQLWAGMAGDEKTRFCDVCQKNVHNLSMMNAEERRTLLANTGESPCVAYFNHVNGTPVDVTALTETNPLKHILTQAAMVSLGSMTLMTACSKSESETAAKEQAKAGYLFVAGVVCSQPPDRRGPPPGLGQNEEDKRKESEMPPVALPENRPASPLPPSPLDK